MELLPALRLCYLFSFQWILERKDYSNLATNRFGKGRAELWLGLEFENLVVGGGGWVGPSQRQKLYPVKLWQ